MAFQNVPGFDASHMMKASTLMEFSDRFSKIVYNYSSVEDYYFQASCANFISNSISVPLLCLNAADDPLVPPSSIPFEKLRSNPNIILLITPRGGHLAWLDKNGECWMNRVCISYLESVLKTKEILLK